MKKDVTSYQNYYFIGIGGIGMSALARYFNAQNKSVSGYDRIKTGLTQQLETEGIEVSDDKSVTEKSLYDLSATNTLVVYSAAFKIAHKLLKVAQDEEFTIEKRAVVLGQLSKQIPTLAVAGTHGKTTTSAILTHILKANDLPVTAIIGGVLKEENTNFIHQGDEVLVVEADEYDRSFLHLSPENACIISTDADHIDTYSTKNDMNLAFSKFNDKVQKSTFLSADTDLEGIKIGFDNENTPINISNLQVKDGRFYFDMTLNNQNYQNIFSPLPGKHNVQNTAFALALAQSYQPEQIEEFITALDNFQGIKRRFNIVQHSPEQVVIDDYAHHPEAIKAVYTSLREMFPKDEIAVFFQPHLYSRTQQFEDEFAVVLALFDAVYLLPIYPAREEPIQGVSSLNLLHKVQLSNKLHIKNSELADFVNVSSERIKAILGAGDIGQLVESLQKSKL